MELKFVDFNKDLLEKSWVWLNDPEIKELTNTPDFTSDIQKAWIYSLSEKSN